MNEVVKWLEETFWLGQRVGVHVRPMAELLDDHPERSCRHDARWMPTCISEDGARWPVPFDTHKL